MQKVCSCGTKTSIDLSYPTLDCSNTFKHFKHIMLAQSTFFPQSNPQPHYTLKSTRLRTPTTLGFVFLCFDVH
jgi:hypothetical protein